MSTYLLIHGAGSDGFYWHWVEPLLTAAGHRVVAPDLPAADPEADLDAWIDTAVGAIGTSTHGEIIVVAQSLGGFCAPVVAERLHARLIVLLAAMVPNPGERAWEYWKNTDWESARVADAHRRGVPLNRDFDATEEFLHDVPADVLAVVMAHGEPQQTDKIGEQPCPFTAWPDIPTRFILCRDDRFFPADYLRRVARERLGIESPDEIGGGHCPAFSRPRELVDALERIRHEELG